MRDREMHNKFPKLTDEHLRILRRTELLHGGEYEGIKFIRCGRNVDDAWRIASEIREATGATETECTMSTHPDFGNYIRIQKGTALYHFICYMKS